MNPSTPPPRSRPTINTNLAHDFSSSTTSPSSPLHIIPSLQVPVSPRTDISSTSPQTQKLRKANSNNRARTESRKLLAHVLDQLERRTLPRDIFDAYDRPEDQGSESNFNALLQSVKGAVKQKKTAQEDGHSAPAGTGADDPEEDEDHEYSTYATYNLMRQLKDLLRVSVDQDWHILDDNPSDQTDEPYEHSGRPGMSPFRRSRNSLQPGSRRDRSYSPSASDGKRTRTPELLSSCIAILASVVLEDCRFQITSPRPSCPPNALQALTLDVAQFLLHTHRHDPNIISKIGFAMIPAFSTFRAEMHGRLLSFFETAVIRGVLEDLGQLQGTHDLTAKPLDSEGLVAIHIDPVRDSIPYSNSAHSQWEPWSVSPDSARKLQSTYAPSQSLAIYSLSSLIAPLLAIVLEFVDLEPKSGARTDTLHRFRRLLKLIIETKPDACTDVLQVVGYHTPKARRTALSILCAVWPNATGHIVTSRPFVDLYAPPGQSGVPTQISNEHNFVPWRFSPYLSSSTFPGPNLLLDCCSCTNPIDGFGLMCTLCACSVHFDCYDYPEGNNLLQYPLSSDSDVQCMAMNRFSTVQVAPGSSKLDIPPRQSGHTFRPVTIFNLCLCMVCRQPLWGCASQGLNCASCLLFAHSECATRPSTSDLPVCSPDNVNSEFFDIVWSELRRSCMEYYHDILKLSYDELLMLSFEELSVVHATMWTQAQIISTGVSLGSIVVTRTGIKANRTGKYALEEFELHHVLRWCEDLLSADKQQSSNAMDDYMEANSLTRSKHFIMFDWNNLMSIRSIVRSPYTEQPLPHASSSELLSVSQPGHHTTSTPDAVSPPFDVISLAHMRDALGYELNIHSDTIARLLLSHLHHLGFFERVDFRASLFHGTDATQVYCSFPLPFGLDLSPTVEALFVAVEGCLDDLDLSVTEVGMLLLIRRLCPNGLTSDYALRRLMRCVLSWILVEDDHLAIILKDYLAQNQPLPGVPQDPVKWPSSDKSRPAQSTSASNGGDYLATRRSLLTRYIKPWLLALHNLDPVAYADLVYQSCLNFESSLHSIGSAITNKDRLAFLDKTLRHVTRLLHYQITFSTFDSIFLHWLDAISDLPVEEEPIYSLTRLFPRETDATNAYAMNSDQPDVASTNTSVDPWQVVLRIAGESKSGLGRSLKWLCLLARSGVDIPLAMFKTFSTLLSHYDGSLSDSLLFAKALMASTWLKPKGRQEIQIVISQLHERLIPHITGILKGGGRSDDIIVFIRVSLACCLLLYGCDRTKLSGFGLIVEADITGLPTRRKMAVRGSVIVDPIVINPRLMDALGHYMAANVENISCLAGKFLYLFLTDSPYLESYEMDNFILRNGRSLATCAWQLYDLQLPEMAELRAHFLLRTLVVDSEPFRDILENSFLPTCNWERRLLAITRLSRVMLDITSPAFNIEDRQWRSSVADVFYYFFTSLWADQRVEIRMAVEAHSANLLPAHLLAMLACWNELLSKSPIAERLKLVSFLIQLRSYFPRWQVLSWNAIVDALADDEYNENDPAAAHLSLYGLPSVSDPDVANLRTSIVFLSLQMISDGIKVDSFTLLKIKNHLVEVIGFRDVSVVPSHDGQLFQVQFGGVSEIADIALPCINQLLPLMDASHPIDIAPLAMTGADDDERPVPVLVGSVFVDVFLSLLYTVKDLTSLPILTCKNMLETLCVVIYKHDFENRVLRHLQHTLRRAVMRALEFFGQDISYDLRQLALSAVHAFVKRWHSIMGSFIYTAIESVAAMVVSHSQLHGQDALATQARVFLDTNLTKYAKNGLFANLLKRPLAREFFLVLKQVTDVNAKSTANAPQSLHELLLRDVLTRVIDADPVAFQNVLNNIQMYVELVHHQNFSAETMQFVGQQLAQFSRRASDWNPESVDPSPLVDICATLLHHNKTLSRELLPYLDTILRILLNRLSVNAACLSRLLHVTNTLHRKSQSGGGVPVANNISNLLFEVLADGMRLKARVMSSTLSNMLEAVTSTDDPGGLSPVVNHLPSFVSLVDPAMHFLQNHSWPNTESDFAASLAIARMVLQVSAQDPNIFARSFDHGTDKMAHTNLKVRTWSILAIAALQEAKEDWCTGLFARLSSFSYTYYASIRAYCQGASNSDLSLADLNHAYIAVKLWILLAHKVSKSGGVVQDSQTFRTWNELWPPFQGLIDRFELEPEGGLYLNAGTLVLSSVADLFIFMRSLHTPSALHTSTYITTLNRLRQLGPSETIDQKLTRALRYMSEPPLETSFETLVNQATKDIMAAEKLRALEGKVIQDKRAPEKHKRDLRVTS